LVRSLPLALACLAAVAIGGCRKEVKPPPPPPKPEPPPQVSDLDLRSYKPNEAGAVMVIMYHRIEPNKPNNDMNRTPDQFRKDLGDLYDRGYRPVTLREFAENRMDVPAGKTPVVITFDDAYLSQFKYLDPAASQIDPDCAVGIMEAFAASHPDWKPKATFFILHGGKNPPAFYQEGLTEAKFAHLLEIGCEIGSHSLTHRMFNRLSASDIQREVAGSIKVIKELAPNADVTSLAIPYGRLPKSKEALDACVRGSADGIQYSLSAVALAAWRPTMAPITKVTKVGPFAGAMASGDMHRIERVLPQPRKASQAGTLEYYLKFFDDNPGMRYVSDGNPKVVAVPKGSSSLVDEAKVAAQGKRLQVYTLAVSGASAPSASH
jgi:peptidoglycan/xylan/chitin deacetylase (PgdA/CDA1 family)